MGNEREAKVSQRRLSRRYLWIDPLPSGIHLSNLDQRRIQLTQVLDFYGFNWQVWAVAATGFFTDSYNLFATNVILPILGYVYWYNETSSDNETAINAVSLAGSLVGQILFGVLADRFGRQKLYGLELIIVIISTFGVVQSGWGIPWPDYSKDSMSALGWLLAWRFIMGIGIGAEYPLSSVITAEWASYKSRARMLASVFLMQPLGQAAAYIVCLIALAGLDAHYGLRDKTDPRLVAPVVDKLWRWVTGLGAIPAVVAIIFRLTIPESGRFTLDVQKDAYRAIKETQAHFGANAHASSTSLDLGDNDLELSEELQNIHSNPNPPAPDAAAQAKQFSRQDLYEYFIAEGNWRYLAATSACWFCLDFAYYGLQINNPRFLSRLWASGPPTNASATAPAWQPTALPLQTILNITETTLDPTGSLNPITIHRSLAVYSTPLYNILLTNARNALISVSIGSLLGSVLLIKTINYLPRKRLLVWSFLGLALLVAGTGVSFLFTFGTRAFGVTLMLYILCQFCFNLGPNSLTFILPAEIFPTRYRASCHGISAAAGKLASVIVQLTLPHFRFGGRSARDLDNNRLGYVLIIFAGVLALGAPVAWAWLPEVQKPRGAETGLTLPSKTLEELAGGKRAAEEQGDLIGFRPKLRKMFSKR